MHLIQPVVFFSRFHAVVSESRGVAAYAAHTLTCANLRSLARSQGIDLSLMPDWAILDLYLHRCDADDVVFTDLLSPTSQDAAYCAHLQSAQDVL